MCCYAFAIVLQFFSVPGTAPAPAGDLTMAETQPGGGGARPDGLDRVRIHHHNHFLWSKIAKFNQSTPYIWTGAQIQ